MDQVPWYVSLIVSWLPFVVWMVSILWAARWIGRSLKTGDGRTLATVVEDYGRELKRSNEMFEQVLGDYRKRLEALEQRK